MNPVWLTLIVPACFAIGMLAGAWCMRALMLVALYVSESDEGWD